MRCLRFGPIDFERDVKQLFRPGSAKFENSSAIYQKTKTITEIPENQPRTRVIVNSSIYSLLFRGSCYFTLYTCNI